MKLKEWIEKYQNWFIYPIGILGFYYFFSTLDSNKKNKSTQIENVSEVSIKDLSNNGELYLNQYVKVKCESYESSNRQILTDRNGETEYNEDTIKYRGTPPREINDVFTIINKYDEFNNCFLSNVNMREFVDKTYNRDFTVYGKIVKWEGSDYKGGKVGLKITNFKKDLSINNIWKDYSLFIVIGGSFLFFIIYILLVRNGILPNPWENQE